MQISKGGDYGLRAVIYLSAQPKHKLSRLEDISESQNIPRKFLAKILPMLVKNGLIKSQQGFQGGYLLGKSPYEITLLDVIEAVEGPIKISRCLDDKNSCDRQLFCEIHPIWNEAKEIFRKFLNEKKIIDILIRKGDDNHEMPKV